MADAPLNPQRDLSWRHYHRTRSYLEMLCTLMRMPFGRLCFCYFPIFGDCRPTQLANILRSECSRCPPGLRLLFLLSQKVAGEVRSDSGKGRDSDISRWGLIWISERQTTVNRDLRGMSRGL